MEKWKTKKMVLWDTNNNYMVNHNNVNSKKYCEKWQRHITTVYATLGLPFAIGRQKRRKQPERYASFLLKILFQMYCKNYLKMLQ
jgi:hypothetical protein